MSDDMVRCSACGTPHGSIEDATVCCEKDKPGVVGPRETNQLWIAWNLIHAFALSRRDEILIASQTAPCSHSDACSHFSLSSVIRQPPS